MKNKKVTINPKDHSVEQFKNHLLVAFYNDDIDRVETLLADIINQLRTRAVLTEYEEKLYRQIKVLVKVIVRKFETNIKQRSFLKLISLIKDFRQYLNNIIKQSSRNITRIQHDSWENSLGLNPAQKVLLYKTLMTFQLSSGCSNFCRRCNEWALPKVRSHFSFSAVIYFLDRITEQNNDEVSLYGASDPLDWEDRDMSILDIIEYIKNLPLDYSLLTKLPKGKNHLLRDLVDTQSNISVSVTNKNKFRIQSIENETANPLAKQHDLDELLIPAGLDEDFVSIKPSITDGYGTEITPDGAYIIIPTFTSALHPFGHKKIRITSDTQFFPLKKTGRHALLIDYFKPLEGYNSRTQEQIFHEGLLDIQIESILLDNGSDELTPPGMRSLWEYFSIFEEKARLQRKRMTPSVFKRLKKRYFTHSRFKDLSASEKIKYLTHIKSHLELCDKNGCLTAKIFSVSYILQAVRHYLETNKMKVQIIKSLLKDEIYLTNKNLAQRIDKKLVIIHLVESELDTFKLFRYLVFQLFENMG